MHPREISDAQPGIGAHMLKEKLVVVMQEQQAQDLAEIRSGACMVIVDGDGPAIVRLAGV